MKIRPVQSKRSNILSKSISVIAAMVTMIPGTMLIPAPPVPAAAPPDPAVPNAGPLGTVASPARPQRTRRRKLVLAAIVLAAAGTAGWFGYHYLTVGRFLVTTDDAYVQAYNTTLAAKIAGYVASVPCASTVTDGATLPLVKDCRAYLAAGHPLARTVAPWPADASQRRD
jgi:hypothetical protein